MKSKLVMLSIATVAVAGSAALIGTASSYAMSGSGSLSEFMAGKFNISQDSVESALKEYRQENQAEREAEVSTSLQTAVDNGTITAEQKTTIEQKQAAIQAEQTKLKDSGVSGREMRDQTKTLHDELKTWADDNGIDLSTIMPRGEGGRMNGPEARS